MIQTKTRLLEILVHQKKFWKNYFLEVIHEFYLSSYKRLHFYLSLGIPFNIKLIIKQEALTPWQIKSSPAKIRPTHVEIIRPVAKCLTMWDMDVAQNQTQCAAQTVNMDFISNLVLYCAFIFILWLETATIDNIFHI